MCMCVWAREKEQWKNITLRTQRIIYNKFSKWATNTSAKFVYPDKSNLKISLECMDDIKKKLHTQYWSSKYKSENI